MTEIVDGKEVRKFVDKEVVYPLRSNINQWLRSFGVFKCGEDIAEAVMLAKGVLQCEGDSMVLDEREVDILKRCFNRHIELTAEGKGQLGGSIHEEAICRVFGMEEVK
jgi:hypothetical protein